MWLAGDGVTQWNIHEGENKYPNELPMSSRNRPSLHHQQSLSHGLGEIWLILYWIIFLHSFISTGRTDKLFDHKALLSAKSHFRVVMANDLASLLGGKSGSQHVFEARNAKDTARTEQKHNALNSGRWRAASLGHMRLTFNDSAWRYSQCQWNVTAAELQLSNIRLIVKNAKIKPRGRF